MPEPIIRAALRESMVEVLEKMFFISAFEGNPQEQGPHQPCMTARLEFEGEPPGWLTLRAPRNAARSIAADFLGEEREALSEGQVEEVVCELANMVCGAVLSRVESRAVFRLGSPRILDYDTAGKEAGVGMGAPLIEDRTMLVTVHAEGEPCTVSEKYAF